MTKSKRHKMIVDILSRRGDIKTVDLIEELGVSIETIRRDYNELEQAGILKKSYGGAVLVSNYLRVTELETWQKRRKTLQFEKELITQKAVDYVAEGSVLAIEIGTTIYALSKHLAKKNNLTIITSDLLAAQEVWHNPSNQVYLVGGLLSQPYFTTGYLSKEFLSYFSLIDVFIFSTDGITINEGFTSISAEINDYKRTLLRKATKNIVVADHSKFDKKAIFHTCNLQEIDLLITDSGAPRDFIEKIKSQGVAVEVVSVENNPT